MSKETPYKYAITHPGKAHRDDFYTCCTILARYPGLPIDRRVPTEEELNDPEVLVIDIGGRHEPELGNFDHHQFEPIPEDQPQSCALSLWLDHLGLLEKSREYFRWLAPMELTDCLGPHALARQVNTTWDKLAPIASSPLEDHILQEFGRRYQLRPKALQDWLCQTMFTFGSVLFHILEETSNAHEEMEEMAFTFHAHHLLVVGFPHQNFQQRHAARATPWTREKYPEAAIILIPDARNGEGTCLYRINDHPQVDFRQLEGNPLIGFLHKNGFIAKINSQDPEVLQQLCKEAIIKD